MLTFRLRALTCVAILLSATASTGCVATTLMSQEGFWETCELEENCGAIVGGVLAGELIAYGVAAGVASAVAGAGENDLKVSEPEVPEGEGTPPGERRDGEEAPAKPRPEAYPGWP